MIKTSSISQSTRRKSSRSERGFTIIELLVVIVVIAILTAITMVAYTGIQSRAKDSIIASDLKNFYTKAEIFRVDHGSYPMPNAAQLELLDYTVTQNAYPSHITWNFDYCTTTDRDEYILTVYINSGEIMYVSSNNSAPVTYDAREYFTPGDSVVGPCYSGKPYSAADRAGLGQIGVLNAEQTAVISNGGFSGKGSTGWRPWTTN